jgi:hypothetical protein
MINAPGRLIAGPTSDFPNALIITYQSIPNSHPKPSLLSSLPGGFCVMPDVVRSLMMAGAILLGVVVLIVIVSVATVNRGEASMKNLDKHH